MRNNECARTAKNNVTDYFMRSIAFRNNWATYHGSELTSEQGRAIPYMFLTQPSASDSTGTYTNSTRDFSKVRVYLQGAIHGNEPAADQGILALLGKMDANQTWTASLLEKLDILVLPRYNPDGVNYFQREFGSNIDPNREGTKLVAQQSRDIRSLISSFEPHVVADMHEYGGPTTYGGIYRHGTDALIAGAKNLNIHPDIRTLTEDTFSAGMSAALVANGLRVEPYVTGPSSRIEGSPIVFTEASAAPTTGRNAMALSQAIVILCELRGIRLADQHFQRRTASSLIMLEAMLNIAHDQSTSILSTIESAVEDFIVSNDDIVLTDSQPSGNRTFTMVDIRDGSIVQAPVTFLSSTPAIANFTRSRPSSYLIPRDWKTVVDRLSAMGLEFEELAYEFRGTVQAYNVTSSTLDTEFTEGTVMNTVTTEFYERELVMPAGSWRLSAKQKNAALAFVTLEPESEVSFVSFGIIPVATGWEYPIFREVV
jgi:predicted deacylase